VILLAPVYYDRATKWNTFFFSGQMGQRTIVGKGLIDLAPGFPPEVLLEITQQAINNTQRYNREMHIETPFQYE